MDKLKTAERILWSIMLGYSLPFLFKIIGQVIPKATYNIGLIISVSIVFSLFVVFALVSTFFKGKIYVILSTIQLSLVFITGLIFEIYYIATTGRLLPPTILGYDLWFLPGILLVIATTIVLIIKITLLVKQKKSKV